VGCGFFEVVVDSGRFAATTSSMLEARFFSDVINFRLELVITPKRAFCSEVVVFAACTLTTTSMLAALCVDGVFGFMFWVA